MAVDQHTRTIQLELHSLKQLFNSLDPSPFHERDLDDDAEEYIVSYAMELPTDAHLRLALHLEEVPQEPDPQSLVAEAVSHYFAYRAELKRRELRDLLRRGRLSLIIGLLFMAICIGLVQMLGLWADHAVAKILKESLVVGGWVALWRPMEIFLYDWWPISRLRRLYARLSRMTVEVRAGPR